MRKVIYKYDVEISDSQTVDIPHSGSVLVFHLFDGGELI